MLAMTNSINSIELPNWLSSPTPSTQKKELRETQFENFFETILNKISQGINLKECLRDDRRDFDYTQLLRWIHKDPQRRSRYYEAQEIGSEMIAAEILEIADAVDNMEDVQRSKLRIDSRQFLLKTWNRKRYGDIKTLEVNQQINVLQAQIDAGKMRVIEGKVIDAEDIE